MKTTNEFYKKGPEMDGLLGRMEAYAPIDLERIKAEIAQAKRGGTQIRGIAVSITNTGGLHGDEFYSHALVTRGLCSSEVCNGKLLNAFLGKFSWRKYMYLPKTERWELKVKAGKEFVLFIDRLKLTDPEMAVRLQRQAENAGESFVGLEACRLELTGITNGAGPRYKYRVLRCPLLTTCNAAGK